MGSFCSSNTTSTTQIPSWLSSEFQSNILPAANQTATTPYQPYTGQLTAGLNPTQNQAISLLGYTPGAQDPYINQASSDINAGFGTTQGAGQYYGQAAAGLGAATPYFQAGASSIANAGQYQQTAEGLAQQAAGPLQFQQYLSPYTQDVVNATQGQFNNTNAQAINNLMGSAIGAGNAFGGDRAGVAEGNLANQEQLAQAPVIAGLYNTGFQTALGAAENQAGQENTAAGTIAGLGQQNINAGAAYGNLGTAQVGAANAYGALGNDTVNQGQTEAAQGVQTAGVGNTYQTGLINSDNALLSAGTTAQATSQAALNAEYQQYENAIAFPYQQTGWLAGVASGLNPGSTTSGTSTPSFLSTIGLAAGGRVIRRATGGGLGDAEFPTAGGPLVLNGGPGSSGLIPAPPTVQARALLTAPNNNSNNNNKAAPEQPTLIGGLQQIGNLIKPGSFSTPSASTAGSNSIIGGISQGVNLGRQAVNFFNGLGSSGATSAAGVGAPLSLAPPAAGVGAPLSLAPPAAGLGAAGDASAFGGEAAAAGVGAAGDAAGAGLGAAADALFLSTGGPVRRYANGGGVNYLFPTAGGPTTVSSTPGGGGLIPAMRFSRNSFQTAPKGFGAPNPNPSHTALDAANQIQNLVDGASKWFTPSAAPQVSTDSSIADPTAIGGTPYARGGVVPQYYPGFASGGPVEREAVPHNPGSGIKPSIGTIGIYGRRGHAGAPGLGAASRFAGGGSVQSALNQALDRYNSSNSSNSGTMQGSVDRALARAGYARPDAQDQTSGVFDNSLNSAANALGQQQRNRGGLVPRGYDQGGAIGPNGAPVPPPMAVGQDTQSQQIAAAPPPASSTAPAFNPQLGLNGVNPAYNPAPSMPASMTTPPVPTSSNLGGGLGLGGRGGTQAGGFYAGNSMGGFWPNSPNMSSAPPANTGPALTLPSSPAPGLAGNASLSPSWGTANKRGGRIRGYDDGGEVDDTLDFDQRIAPAVDAIADGTFDPVGANSTTLERKELKDAIPLPVARPAGLGVDPDVINPGDPFRLDGTYAAGEPPMTAGLAAANFASNQDDAQGPIGAYAPADGAPAPGLGGVAAINQQAGITPDSDDTSLAGYDSTQGNAGGLRGLQPGAPLNLTPQAGLGQGRITPPQSPPSHGSAPAPGILGAIGLTQDGAGALLQGVAGFMSAAGKGTLLGGLGSAITGATGSMAAAEKQRQDQAQVDFENQIKAATAAENQQKSDRDAATSEYVAGPNGTVALRPGYLEAQRQILQQQTDLKPDKYTIAGTITDGDKSRPAVLEASTGKVIDSATGKPIDASGSATFQPKGGRSVDTGQVRNIIDGIKKGDLPPDTSQLYGMAGAVKAGLAKDGFNLVQAQLEKRAAEKQIATLNGPQMTRFVGLAQSVQSTISRVKELSEQLQQTGIPLYNKADLATHIQTMGNTASGRLATAYMEQVGILKEEFANLANGGYAPTEPAWKLANEQINGNFGVKQMDTALGEIQRAINYRVNAIPGLATAGPGAANRYMGRTENTPIAAPVGASGETVAAPPVVSSKADYDKLAPNTKFVGADGKQYRKP